MSEQCNCGKPGVYKVCGHIASGEIKDIQIKENRATCGKCSKLLPDESFSDLCMRCLQKISAPDDAEKQLAEIEAKEQEDISALEQLQSKLEERAARKKELEQWVIYDKFEKFMAIGLGIPAHMQEGGAVYKDVTELQTLMAEMLEKRSDLLGSLSKDEFRHIFDWDDPRVAEFLDMVKSGGFAPNAKVHDVVQRICKRKAFWEETK